MERRAVIWGVRFVIGAAALLAAVITVQVTQVALAAQQPLGDPLRGDATVAVQVIHVYARGAFWLLATAVMALALYIATRWD